MLDADTLRNAAMTSKAWPYEEARKLSEALARRASPPASR